jgi:hypothetical protein
MPNKLGTHAAGYIFETFKVRLQKFTDKIITPEEFIKMLNYVVDEYVMLGGLLDDDEYRDKFDLVDPTGQAGGLIIGADIGVGDFIYTDATKTLHIETSVFAGGNFSPGFTSFNAIYTVGGVIYLRQAVGGAYLEPNVIESVTDTENAILRDAWGANYAKADISGVMLIIPGTVDSIVIGGLAAYKKIHRIVGIFSSLYGECFDKPLAEFKNITDPRTYPYSSKRDQILYTRDGENLYFVKGDLASYGTRTLHYIRTPEHITVLADLVDLRDSHTNVIVDNLIVDGIQTLKIPMPPELEPIAARLEKSRRAANEQLAKHLEGKE